MVEELHLLDRDYFRFLRRLVEASPQACARKLRRTEPSPTTSAASAAPAAPAAPPAGPAMTPTAGSAAEAPASPAAGGSGAGSGGLGLGLGSSADTLSAGAAASGGAVSMSGVSGGGGGSANPAAPAGGPRGGTTTRSDDAERAALGTLNLALQFLFRVRPVGEPPASRLRTRSRTGSPDSVSQQAVDAPLAAAPPLARLAGRENGYHQACLPHVNPSVRTRRLFTDGCA